LPATIETGSASGAALKKPSKKSSAMSPSWSASLPPHPNTVSAGSLLPRMRIVCRIPAARLMLTVEIGDTGVRMKSSVLFGLTCPSALAPQQKTVDEALVAQV
jgi:hypothetical protein